MFLCIAWSTQSMKCRYFSISPPGLIGHWHFLLSHTEFKPWLGGSFSFSVMEASLHHKWTHLWWMAWGFLKPLPRFQSGLSLRLDSWGPYKQELEPGPGSKMQGPWWWGWTLKTTPSKRKDLEGVVALSQWLCAGHASYRGGWWPHRDVFAEHEMVTYPTPP